MMERDLTIIGLKAEAKEAENLRFRDFLKKNDAVLIDDLVMELNERISPQIDCTKCGNCCRSLMINVDGEDATRLADHLQITPESFEERYIEISSEGEVAVMSAIPCHFLQGSRCAVYLARPRECREFPGLHQKDFTSRLFATFMHYGRCPIIYNVIEALKERTAFGSVTNHDLV